MEHICVQFSKYDLHHLDVFPQMPWWLNLDRRILWSTVLKAFFNDTNFRFVSGGLNYKH